MSYPQYNGYGMNGWPGSYPPPTPVVPQTPALPKMEVVRVHGEEGANAFAMGPNSSIILLDETEPAVWLKTTDGAGYATISGYDLIPKGVKSEKKEEVQKPIEDDFKVALLERLSSIERTLSENGKSYAQPTKSAERQQPVNVAGSKTDQRHDRNASELKQS